MTETDYCPLTGDRPGPVCVWCNPVPPNFAQGCDRCWARYRAGDRWDRERRVWYPRNKEDAAA